MSHLVLTKHHGLGNDFLVLLDLAGEQPVDAARAAALCDRHRGIGADGLIRVTAGGDGADLTMELRNADGGVAEMSGNGISCLAQAAVDAGVAPWPELRVATAAGVRTLVVAPESSRGSRKVTVSMGAATVTGDLEVDGSKGLLVDVGNPHLVLRDSGQDLVAVGTAHADRNVELIEASGPDAIRMRVHERGVGPTDACGTGAVAAAVAARDRGMTLNGQVTVEQPGGPARVEIDDDGVAWLTVPVEYIGRIEVP
jgi:diaminopimelate epimerase